MADFLSNDINDAKKRVEEMRKKAQNYVNPPKASTPTNKNQNDSSFGFITDIMGSLFSSNDNDSSTGLILALILILSREGGNNKLILALLYILL